MFSFLDEIFFSPFLLLVLFMDSYLDFPPSGNQGTEDLLILEKKMYLKPAVKSGISMLTWPQGLDRV